LKLTLRDVFENLESMKGWLYLKSKPWTLNSDCLFYVQDLNLSDDEQKQKKEQLRSLGWVSTLPKEDIEDIVLNTKEQKDDASPNDFLKAFIFYIENDAFIEW
jgi:hypothetical protein